MILNASAVIARKIKEWNPEETIDEERMTYALALQINKYGVIFISLLAGLFLGSVVQCIIAMVSFALLRRFTGGYHFRSLTMCTLMTAAIIVFSSKLPINNLYTVLLNIVSSLLVLRFSNRRIMPATLIISVNFIFLNPAAALAFFSQSLLLISKWR
ncbi:accessory gene regulator B family protein [Paenibacillus chitinolyticus]|uniref:accessory gene regulator B family protein n=1 Tax=Paenibacillus chitinolyticus TaxID=79263 RepID=UPI003670D4C7